MNADSRSSRYHEPALAAATRPWSTGFQFPACPSIREASRGAEWKGEENRMRTGRWLPILTAGFAGVLLPAGLVAAQSGPALTGLVTSDAEGAMEGVVVSAKGRLDRDRQRHQRRAGPLQLPGRPARPRPYTITIRAVGYDLPARHAEVAGSTYGNGRSQARARRKTSPRQMSNAEWMASMPGTEDQKAMLLDCVGCHTLERIVRSTHDADEWTQVITRMRGYAPVSQPIKPQRMLDPARAGTPEQYRKMAEYLATINLSAVDEWQYPLKTLPRPTGRGDPRHRHRIRSAAGDAPSRMTCCVDDEGSVWYSDFGKLFISKFDPKTLKLTEYPVQEVQAGRAGRQSFARIRQDRHAVVRHHVPGLARHARSQDRADQVVSRWRRSTMTIACS